MIVVVAAEVVPTGAVGNIADRNDDRLIGFVERILDSGNRHGAGGATGWNNDLSTTARVVAGECRSAGVPEIDCDILA